MTLVEVSSLRISDSLSLPIEASTWVFAYLAKRGAGKTYNASVQAEEMLKAGIPIVVVDAMGIWWGLRASADGKGPGLPIVVFGGEHADLPLVSERAADIAKAVVESNISCVLDLSGFSKYESRKVLTAFLNELYRLNRVDRHVFIEESDIFAPQRPIGPDEALCLSVVDNFVRRGGNHNLGCTLITQRSAVLNKDILTQSDCLVILRTLAPQDKKAIQAWVEEQTDEDREQLKKWYDSLKTLENGEAWIWHPEKPVIYEKVKFRKRETFHATREFIRSPLASQLKLMNVSEFVSKFKTIFEQKHASNAPMHTSVDTLVYTTEIKRLTEETQRLKKLADDAIEQEAKTHNEMCQFRSEVEEKLENYEDFVQSLVKILPTELPTGSPLPSGLPTESNTIGLQKVTKIVDVAKVKKKVGVFSTDTVKGKVLFLARENGFFSNWKNLSEVGKALTEKAWGSSPQGIKIALNDLVDAGVLGIRRTDRDEYKLAPDVIFEKFEKLT